ncbi:MAG: energy-coupling factor ABC transporter substrate-binding protein [Geobacter sp.]|nr:energy-coupling factor ABC transporter substrate-binding protein [Geobacter sp.]
MTSRVKNSLLIISVAALAIFPLMVVKKPVGGPGGNQAEIFKGSDDQASAAIKAIAPEYKPWFQSLYKTPSSEIDTLLFALQAAIGAGFIGYYVGYSRGRAKQNQAKPDAKLEN